MKNGLKNGRRAGMPGDCQAPPAGEPPPAAGGAASPCRFDFRSPAVRDLVAALLERPEVQGIQIGKPLTPSMPVEVGLRRRGSFQWWFGRSLFEALCQAEEGVRAR